jgi:hypothetical protein
MGFRWKKVLRWVAPVIAIAVPGIGTAIGSAILGSSAGAAAAAVGLSVSAVTTAVGAATISAGMTAIQGGSVEDVLKAGLSAGVASGVNFAAGGGVTGAAAGSAVGTAIQGGNASQVLTNAFAAGVGAGVQGAMTENPDSGKIIGSAARTYIATGGDMDKTLLNTAATAIGTLKQPTTYTKTTTAKPAPVSTPFKYGNDTYQELDDGRAKVTTQSGNVRIIGAGTFKEIKQDYSADVAAGLVSPTGPTLPQQTVSAVAPVVSPVVTDLDLVRQVAEQPTPTVDSVELERVLVQGQGANVANVAPVSTEITAPRPDTTQGLPAPTAELPPVTVTGKREEEVSPTVTELPPVTVTGQQEPTVEFDPVTITGKREYELDPVTITGKREEVDPTVTELDPVTIIGKRDPIYELDPVTITGKPDIEFDPVTIIGKKEDDIIIDDTTPPEDKEKDPEKEKSEEKPKGETKKIYPTITNVPPPKRPGRPGRQPIITGASPARSLADALVAYRPAGEIEGEESGKERQNVWNKKSLRLKDALGL